MITIQHLTKSYGKKLVLNDLNLSLVDKQIHGLVGENGAGKTTFFECLSHLESFEGSINIPNDIKIGYMPTSLYFYPNMKGFEYIEFCLSARKLKIEKDKINDLNQLFDLPLNEYAVEYSTGMKKKLALMALFLQNNDFYILDEPFNGLDLSASILLKQLVINLKENQKTILISSHIISSLTDICDQILYLKDGTIDQIYQPCDYERIEKDIISGDIKEKLSILERFKS